MICPICKVDLYEKNRYETTGGTHIEIRCSKCNYFDHITIPVIYSTTIIRDVI